MVLEQVWAREGRWGGQQVLQSEARVCGLVEGLKVLLWLKGLTQRPEGSRRQLCLGPCSGDVSC